MAVISLSRCAAILVVLTAASQAKIMDLSHDHTNDLLMSPNNPKYKTKPIFEGAVQPGIYAKFSSYALGEHGGTHLDAPAHFHKAGQTLEKVPLENTIADGVMIDCTKEVDENPDYALTVEKLKAWEKANGDIPKGAAVVVNTNWSHKISDPKKYFNTQTLDDHESYRFPVVGEAAIDYLIDKRQISILAIDGPSPDLMKGHFPVHVKLLTTNKLIVENINDPGRLPARGFRFHATPVKFVGGTGVQVRAFAVFDEGSGSGQSAVGCFVFVVAMVLVSRWFS